MMVNSLSYFLYDSETFDFVNYSQNIDIVYIDRNVPVYIDREIPVYIYKIIEVPMGVWDSIIVWFNGLFK